METFNFADAGKTVWTMLVFPYFIIISSDANSASQPEMSIFEWIQIVGSAVIGAWVIKAFVKLFRWYFCERMNVWQAEEADFTAELHGNWTLENAKGRLHQFIQTNKIRTDYKYTMVGPDHNRYDLVAAVVRFNDFNYFA